MVRRVERADEGSVVREMRLEALEAAQQHVATAVAHAAAAGDLGQARLYARKQDELTAEVLARRQARAAPEPALEHR